MPRAFLIHPADNVATLLANADAGATVAVLGAVPQACVAAEAIAAGHKLALRPVAAGEAIVKFGVRIGHATKPIAPGDWVHLHNLASDLDARSGSLDLHSGAPPDTASAYV
jgi:hypothetical protein